MGRSKPLLPLGDRPVIHHKLNTLRAAGVEEIVVVLGHGADELEQALAGQPVILVRNPDPDSDMAGSVRSGLAAVSSAARGVLVCLTDHPLVHAATIRKLLQVHGQKPGVIAIPSYRRKNGHPTLFPRPVIEELHFLPTLRHVVRRDPGRIWRIEVEDPGVVLDMDTPEDYQRALQAWATVQDPGRPS